MRFLVFGSMRKYKFSRLKMTTLYRDQGICEVKETGKKPHF